MRAFFFVLTSSIICYGCTTPVQWEEPNAQWKGVVETTGLNTFLDCCDPGRNCAKRHYSLVPSTTLRTYVDNNDLRGYFNNENWQAEIPELIDREDILMLIEQHNPKAVFTPENDLIVFTSANPNMEVAEEILFAVGRYADPCDGN